uniref:Uncharacterized protein n=1 Tax=Cacopsylla melanoneura TaxID=428564 RepID=A0A8D8W7Y7_9HEMI
MRLHSTLLLKLTTFKRTPTRGVKNRLTIVNGELILLSHTTQTMHNPGQLLVLIVKPVVLNLQQRQRPRTVANATISCPVCRLPMHRDFPPNRRTSVRPVSSVLILPTPGWVLRSSPVLLCGFRLHPPTTRAL